MSQKQHLNVITLIIFDHFENYDHFYILFLNHIYFLNQCDHFNFKKIKIQFDSTPLDTLFFFNIYNRDQFDRFNQLQLQFHHFNQIDTLITLIILSILNNWVVLIIFISLIILITYVIFMMDILIIEHFDLDLFLSH